MHHDEFEFKSVELSDKSLFDKYFAANVRQNSDYSFANLYMWAKAINLKYTIFLDALILSVGSGERLFLTPPYRLDPSADLCPYLDKIVTYMLTIKGSFEVRAVSQVMKEKIEGRCPDRFDIIEDRDNFEYVYDVGELITLSGKKFHNKRNNLNKFLKNYEYEYDVYSEKYFNECMDMQLLWSQGKDMGACQSARETDAIRRAMEHYEQLDLTGCVIKIGGKVQAFSFGTKLNDDTAVILIEKANNEYQGLYQLVNRDFLKYTFYDCKYVNRQEDMGDEGLRQAKMTYNPIFFATKYILKLKHA